MPNPLLQLLLLPPKPAIDISCHPGCYTRVTSRYPRGLRTSACTALTSTSRRGCAPEPAAAWAPAEPPVGPRRRRGMRDPRTAIAAADAPASAHPSGCSGGGGTRCRRNAGSCFGAARSAKRRQSNGDTATTGALRGPPWPKPAMRECGHSGNGLVPMVSSSAKATRAEGRTRRTTHHTTPHPGQSPLSELEALALPAH